MHFYRGMAVGQPLGPETVSYQSITIREDLRTDKLVRDQSNINQTTDRCTDGLLVYCYAP